MAIHTVAESSPPALMLQTVPYDHLMQQLGVSNVRELEDLLISDCFYPKLISGKLDQKVLLRRPWSWRPQCGVSDTADDQNSPPW